MYILNPNIEIAEKDLLPHGCSFDEERRNFIKKMESCDVLAVPGSGKTTALQAKLHCLSQHLPLEGNQGILVLSHTNNAVDEIKEKLQTNCYSLFEPPHFIGTVQDFVDKFLTIPYYEQFFKRKILAIDDKSYEREIRYYLRTHYSSPISYLLKKRYPFEQIRFYINERETVDVNIAKIPYVKKWDEEGTVDSKHEEIYTYIFNMKKHILKNGILHYDDCYFLAKCYLKKYPFVAKVLRKRFKYIFVDETQDLKKFQLDLLDMLFNCDECCMQRIGDKNQTIYKNPSIDEPEQWITRNEITLMNSYRLTADIAKVVNPFTLGRAKDKEGKASFVVTGLRKLKNGIIPPYLLLFNCKSKHKLLPAFSQIIDKHSLRNIEKRKGFHVIGWNVKESGTNKGLRLKEILSMDISTSDIGKEVYDTLSEFLVFGCKYKDMKECKKVIINILVHTLRLLDIYDTDNRLFSKTRIEAKFSNTGQDFIDSYKLFLYKASSKLYMKKYAECYEMVKNYINNEFSKIFAFNPSSNLIIKEFLGDTFVEKKSTTAMYNDIIVGSIHSVKGQTHCATMYIETYYNGYESSHLFKEKSNKTKKRPTVMYPNPLFQEEANYPQNISNSTMRMMYVGFSRPTHLLCYAVFKDNWTLERIQRMGDLGWIIIDLTENF